jgi:2-methylcitrate dehydratase PrpD
MADDVTEVECQTGTMIRDILVFDEPVTYLQAKFSMQFCVAIALLERNVGLLQVTDEKVNEPKVRQLMKRVRLRYVDQPLAQSDTVKVRLYDGRQYCVSVRKPKGDYELPLTDEEIVSKYRDCAGAVLPKNQVEKSLELILNLEQLEHTNELADVVANIDT